jgi:hypothetical protein
MGADSLFVSSFLVTKSGLYTGNIFIGTDFKIESEVNVSVIQTTAVSSETSALLNITKIWTAGIASYFEMECRDEFGNQIQEPSGFAALSISSLLSTSPISSFISVKFVDHLFQFQSVVMQTGTYFASVHLSGMIIRPSPFAIDVVPGSTCSSNVMLNGVELRNVVATRLSSFSMVTKDSFGNIQSTGGESSCFNISLAKLDEQMLISPFILDLNNSVYIAFYLPTVAGTYRVSVTFGSGDQRAPIHMSPFAIQVQESPNPSVISCSFSVGGTSLIITFSSSTDRGNYVETQPCSSYVADTTSLGNGCSSFWVTDQELYLSLGNGAFVIPGSILNLKGNVIRAYLSSSSYISGLMNVVALHNCPVKVILSSPS